MSGITSNRLTIAALSDIHVKETSAGVYKTLFEQINQDADILSLCGDLTDHGLVKEAEILVAELAAVKIPVVAVLGNHDFESDKSSEVTKILTQARVTILGEETFVFKDVGFAGTTGFAGGFDKYMLNSFGEPMMKQFVKEAVKEELKLESALSRLTTEKKVVLLHYSPIRETLRGENEEIFHFLGSSRLATPIDQYSASVVFHGHAHYGTHEGKTTAGIPVFNVAYPLMQKKDEKTPYKLFTL